MKEGGWKTPWGMERAGWLRDYEAFPVWPIP